MIPPFLRVALAQINPTVGDLTANRDRIRATLRDARSGGAHLIVFPELVISGYPPEDLLLNPEFVCAAERAALEAGVEAPGCAIVLGAPETDRGVLYNTASVFLDGKRVAAHRKIELPNYGVFDEKRYFTPGVRPLILEFGELRVGLTVCEDVWIPGNIVERALAAADVDLVVNISGSPFHAGKQAERKLVLERFARAVGAPVAYCNLVGGQDELVFDGSSLLISPAGETLAAAKRFAEDLLFLEISPRSGDRRDPEVSGCDRVSLFVAGALTDPSPRTTPAGETADEISEIHQALLLGTRDYVLKSGFKHVVIGLSGGIDSALTAAIAVEALGASCVTGVTMPSRFSSGETLSDALLVAERLGVECFEVPIEEVHRVFLECLSVPLGYEVPGAHPPGIEAENLQARIRGTILMTLSNRFGWLALTTGNKSEMAMGYCTLYGDMAGGFAVLKDVYKTTVFSLARRFNERAGREVIPVSTIERAPSAELRPNQKDEDSLPPYAVLDPILKAYVERNRSAAEIAAKTGQSVEMAREVIRKVDLNEYKRRQAPPGVKITPRAFGRDRRMPVVNRWRA